MDFYSILPIFLCICTSLGKICYEDCSVDVKTSRITNVDIVGCQRRSAYDFQKQSGRKVDFHCNGMEGPPCTIMIGKTANFTASFTTGTPIKGFKHYAYAKTYGIEVPWIGMDNSGCPYLEDNCDGNGKKNLTFRYPMKVEEYYPPNNYPVRYEFWAEDTQDPTKQIKIGCIRTMLRLCNKNGCG